MKAHSSGVKYLGEYVGKLACSGDVRSAERGEQAAIEKVGTRAIVLHKKSRRLNDISDLLITIPHLSAVLIGLCLQRGTQQP